MPHGLKSLDHISVCPRFDIAQPSIKWDRITILYAHMSNSENNNNNNIQSIINCFKNHLPFKSHLKYQGREEHQTILTNTLPISVWQCYRTLLTGIRAFGEYLCFPRWFFPKKNSVNKTSPVHRYCIRFIQVFPLGNGQWKDTFNTKKVNCILLVLIHALINKFSSHFTLWQFWGWCAAQQPNWLASSQMILPC